MTVRPEVLKEAWRWAEQADHDYRAAEYLLTMPENCPTDTVCFHCQQCAEKYLKALLICREIPFQKTHDLVVLYNLLSGASTLAVPIEQIQPLNRYAIEARYPGDWTPISMAEAAKALGMAREIRIAIQNILKEY